MVSVQNAQCGVRRRRAFVLLDALIGGILLGLALVVIIGLTGRAISAQTQGERLQIAAMLADEKLSEVLAVGPDEFPSVFETRGRCDEPYGNYEFEIDIDPQRQGDPYLVTAEIFWLAGGRERSLRFETLIAPRLGDDPDPDRQPDETVGRES